MESSTTDAAGDKSTRISDLVEHLFRHEAARIVATLTRILGVEHLALAEDVVQEALVRALKTWPYRGVPDNPSAWIMRAARNLALDHVRRERSFRDKLPAIGLAFRADEVAPAAETAPELPDDRLRMLFVCCHPRIPAEAQVALALKVLGGFGPAEIAKGLLTTEAAIAKRLTRARQQLRDEGIAYEIPEGPELPPRLDAVLRSLYLLFNEGYKASTGERLVREEICQEAIRLAELLVAHPSGDTPRAHALVALMLLNAARLPARQDADGALLRLNEQDRSRWDRAMIARGMFHFAKSATGPEAGEYHLQAGIAACHCAAADYASTDWERILSLYDQLIALNPSPVVALNRAVVVAEARGPRAGLDAVAAIPDRRMIEDYVLLHAVTGELHLRLGESAAATRHLRRALELAPIPSERSFIAKRLKVCETVGAPVRRGKNPAAASELNI